MYLFKIFIKPNNCTRERKKKREESLSLKNFYSTFLCLLLVSFLMFSYCRYMYLDRDIDIYWYYDDNSNNRNDDSDGGHDCGNANTLVGTS